MEEYAWKDLNVMIQHSLSVKNIIVTVRKAGVEKNARLAQCFVSIVWAIRMKAFIRTSV